jgi:hypothetical protein
VLAPAIWLRVLRALPREASVEIGEHPGELVVRVVRHYVGHSSPAAHQVHDDTICRQLNRAGQRPRVVSGQLTRHAQQGSAMSTATLTTTSPPLVRALRSERRTQRDRWRGTTCVKVRVGGQPPERPASVVPVLDLAIEGIRP